MLLATLCPPAWSCGNGGDVAVHIKLLALTIDCVCGRVHHRTAHTDPLPHLAVIAHTNAVRLLLSYKQ
jgi:hypothetical protein